MRAIGWTGDDGGCGFYRIREKIRGLALAGWDSKTVDQLDPADGAHVLLTQRVHQPRQIASLQALKADGRILIVNDLDDDLWRVPLAAPAGYYWASVERQERLRVGLRAAHLITVSTEPLRARVQEELGPTCPPISIVPNTVPESALSLPAPETGRPLTIGWSGSDSHAEDWQAMARPVLEILRQFPDVRLQLGGFIPRQFRDHAQVDTVDWKKPGREYFYSLRGIDIGLAPLVPGALNDSKSPIKALEYAALGIPCIASRVGPYPDFLDGIGVCATSPAGVRDNIAAWIQIPELRSRFARQARKAAREHTTEHHARNLATLYRHAFRQLQQRKVA